MQTVLLAREIARMIRWDGDSKNDVNKHFVSITEVQRTTGYISTLSIEDVLKSVLMATLKDSKNQSLHAAYYKVLDDLDDKKDLSFTLIQDVCARQISRNTDERPPPTWTGTPRLHQGSPAAPRSTKPLSDGVSAFLCNFLGDHGVKSVKVFKKAGLRHDTPADWQKQLCNRYCSNRHTHWQNGDAVHALYMASQQFMSQTQQQRKSLWGVLYSVST